MRYIVCKLLFVIPVIAHCEVYRWVDENGQVHYGSVPPKIQEPYKAGGLTDEDKLIGEKKQKKKLLTEETNQKEKQINTNSTGKINSGPKKHTGNNNIQNRESAADNKINKAKTEINKRDKQEKERLRKEKYDTLIERIKKDIGQIPGEKKSSTNHNEVGNKNTINEANKKKKPEIRGTTPGLDDLKTNKKDKKENEEIEIKKEIESVEKATHKDSNREKCGFFKSFVENYKDRIKYECPSEHCDLLRRKLEKYQQKVNKYCSEETEDNL